MKNILYEDNDIIVVHKPAGIATQTARLGQQDMVSELKNYLAKNRGTKQSTDRGQGEPYLGVVHRLDQPVSGILVFAKNKEAAASLSKQVTNGTVQKFYYAVVLGEPSEKQGRLENYLYKDGKTNLSMIVKPDFPEAKEAALEFQWVKTLVALEADQEVSLMRIQLLTGRHHQIRVQMSHAGMPLLGDAKYGSEESRAFDRQVGCKNVALCAYKLSFKHPKSAEKMDFEIQPNGTIFIPFFAKGV